MTASIWIWQFLRPVTPRQASEAVIRAGLSEDWIPEVPFSEVATRAVGKTKAKRTTEPGVILWTAPGGAQWFADLVEERLVFQKPRSKTAKVITGRLERARDLRPSDLDGFVETMVRGWGAVSLMGPLWIVPDVQGVEPVITMLRSIPGAAVAAIPIDSEAVAGEVLVLLASRVANESERLQAGVGKLKPESVRRRAAGIRGLAEDVASLAELYETDMTALGEPLLKAEAKILARLSGRRYPVPLDFTGGSSSSGRDPDPGGSSSSRRTKTPEPPDQGSTERATPIVTRGEIPPGGDPTDGRTITRIGDPPPAAPVPRIAREADP